MDYIGTPDAIPMHRLMHGGPVERDAAFDAAAHAIRPDDLATIIYTSGTTGTPKGAMLTQGNLASNLLHSLDSYPLGPDDVSLSFLPLSHITARHVDYAMLYHGVTVAYCPHIDQLKTALPEIRPTIFVAVPRVYEKIRSQAEVQTKSGMKHKVYQWALKVGRAHRDEILAGKRPTSPDWKLADRLVFSKIRQALGGRVKIYISGGAPLGRDLAEWYADVGIRIHEGYGLTETSPVIALNKPNRHKIGTVGPPLRNVEVRIADDGEILVRGPSVFKGYWNMPAETAAAFDSRWLVQDRRHRQSRRRRLPLRHRPQERPDQDFRRQVHRSAAHRAQAAEQCLRRRGHHDRRPPQVSLGRHRARLRRTGALGARERAWSPLPRRTCPPMKKSASCSTASSPRSTAILPSSKN